jgi:hypothetical protein
MGKGGLLSLNQDKEVKDEEVINYFMPIVKLYY